MGVNLIFNGDEKFQVDGAAEAIERFDKGEITALELYDIILDAPVVPIVPEPK